MKGKGICYNCGKSGLRLSSVMEKVGKAKGKGKKGDSKGWNDSKGWTVGKGWSDSNGWNTSGKGWEQQRPAVMNNLERDSKQYDVLVMGISTQEKTVRDSDWCVLVKHVAKLDRMRGHQPRQASNSLLIQRKRTETMTTPNCLGLKQFDLEDDDSYK